MRLEAVGIAAKRRQADDGACHDTQIKDRYLANMEEAIKGNQWRTSPGRPQVQTRIFMWHMTCLNRRKSDVTSGSNHRLPPNTQVPAELS